MAGSGRSRPWPACTGIGVSRRSRGRCRRADGPPPTRSERARRRGPSGGGPVVGNSAGRRAEGRGTLLAGGSGNGRLVAPACVTSEDLRTLQDAIRADVVHGNSSRRGPTSQTKAPKYEAGGTFELALPRALFDVEPTLIAGQVCGGSTYTDLLTGSPESALGRNRRGQIGPFTNPKPPRCSEPRTEGASTPAPRRVVPSPPRLFVLLRLGEADPAS